MIDGPAARALTEIAARANELLSEYSPGFEPRFGETRAARSQATKTMDALNVVAPEGAYFIAAGPSGERRYFRDGAFALRDGNLCAPAGEPVLGFPAAGHGTLGPLALDPLDRALQRASDARVESDGTLAYTRTMLDPRTGEASAQRVAAGKLALARFPAGTGERRDAVPHVGAPADGNFGALLTYARDGGRLDLDAALLGLHEAYLRFDALRSAQHARAGLEKTALDLLK